MSALTESIFNALRYSINKLESGYPLEREVDFQAVLFCALQSSLPDAIVRMEYPLKRNYQSYYAAAKDGPSTQPSRVDIHITCQEEVIVCELKYFSGASLEAKADMIADIAKVERIVESGEASQGFVFQIVRSGFVQKLVDAYGTREIDKKRYQSTVGKWQYDFEIKGGYRLVPVRLKSGRHLIEHHVLPQ